MGQNKHIFLTSFILTVIVFAIGIMLSYSLDFLRIGEVQSIMRSHELSTEAYLVEQSFIDYFGGNTCESINKRLYGLKREMHQVGIDLTNYGGKSMFKKKDFDYLKRKYFLLELKFYSLVMDFNEKCGDYYIPILFFYEIDDDISERQGLVLDEITQAYKERVVVLSFDKDYTDEPLVPVLVKRHNITKTPTMIMGGKVRIEKLAYRGEINSTILRLLNAPDRFAGEVDFNYVLDAASVNKSSYLKLLSGLLQENISLFAKGDVSYVVGRLTGNISMICSSLKYYDAYKPKNPEEQALVYETYASMGCGRNRKAFLLEAADIWEIIGNPYRASLWRKLANRERIEFNLSIAGIESGILEVRPESSTIVFGTSYFSLNSSDILLSQVDRVNRDWYGAQLNHSPFDQALLEVFSERLTYPPEELLPEIGWHEGARIKELKRAGLTHIHGAGTLAARINGTWYAPNEEGIFMFEIPIDKISYPTTRFMREDIAVIIDTHGVNMLVEQAVRNNASVVVGCCDHPGKIAAAQYLSRKDIKVICFPDKYLPLALGSSSQILGSPPIKHGYDSIILGKQPVEVQLNETIIALDVSDYSAVQSYYDTPARYFRELQKSINLSVAYVPIDRPGQFGRLTMAAEEHNSHVIAARVFSSQDYDTLKAWLEEDGNNRLVLFHSAPYPYGYKILREYPEQTTFDDIHPVVK